MSTTTRRARDLSFACALMTAATAATPASAQTPEPTKLPTWEMALSGPTRLVGKLPPSAFHRRHKVRSMHARITRYGHAIAPAGAPKAVKRMIKAGNHIALTPYVWGGGHGSWVASGYDCSGSVGYALHGAKLLSHAVTSGNLMSYGKPGKGRWVTIYANGGHTWMIVAGLRFDTSAHGIDGSRWTQDTRDMGGYVVRHPAGL